MSAPVCLLRRGVYYSLGRYADALVYYQQAVASAPSNKAMHYNLANALLQVSCLLQGICALCSALCASERMFAVF